MVGGVRSNTSSSPAVPAVARHWCCRWYRKVASAMVAEPVRSMVTKPPLPLAPATPPTPPPPAAGAPPAAEAKGLSRVSPTQDRLLQALISSGCQRALFAPAGEHPSSAGSLCSLAGCTLSDCPPPMKLAPSATRSPPLSAASPSANSFRLHHQQQPDKFVLKLGYGYALFQGNGIGNHVLS